MSVVIVVVIALVAVGATALGLRHLYLKAARPHGFECSLRIRSGEVPGLTHRFRAGYAGRELDGFVWRRLAWPSAPVRFPATAVHLDQEWAPSVRDHLLSVPASFAVVAVELDDDTRVDLALARRKRERIIAALGS
ncbi:MAG: hypothetical protein ACXVJW_07085 [Acidimicrobiia bacterium]